MADIDADRLLFIVTGVTLTAEAGDRPLAYTIERAAREHLAELIPQTPGEPAALTPVVISDVYYLNNEDIQSRPTICVGGPGVNMLAGTLVENVPMAVAVENVLVIQMDVEFNDTRVAVWGMTHVDTVRAVDLFISRYLRAYLEAVVQQSDEEDEQDFDAPHSP